MRSRSPRPSASLKRKQRDFENDHETNIKVVVRCRGRNDREVTENSGVVVSTDGVKGTTVELSTGPNALSNKTYEFDKVFSAAADQIMVFNEVVVPILDEVVRGLNCTLFAYGQTGTGKTYTMSGDISDQNPLPDSAGIVPRVLHSLFAKLDPLRRSSNGPTAEHIVKVSFIELYNEELRDLLSADDSTKLKIFDGDGKKGNSGTIVQGMEETFIGSASEGIRLLQRGSHKRQVAATKFNDFSSRSHTIFTVTVKRATENGEFVSAGKLNLVDLAGSENIQRSGAENKRATEAGLINKSLLTLGRVINALVDSKVKHIPYRESKLTRLLQDSLGGETKTCIIATLSPARSNLEETMSTLDYAFRAKNIRNKPQYSHMIPKYTLLKEFTAEIEKLKADLNASRQRSGIYLTQESYDAMTAESESRRILAQEQRDRIEIMDYNLKSKDQDLYTLTTGLNAAKKDNETTKAMLTKTTAVLDKTHASLESTKRSLEEEIYLRGQHEQSEHRLQKLGRELLATIGTMTTDIGHLHSKLQRTHSLHSENRSRWEDVRANVSQTTSLVEDRLKEFQDEQQTLVSNIQSQMQLFVQSELQKLEAAKAELTQKSESFRLTNAEVSNQTAQSRDELNSVIKQVEHLRDDVKQKVGSGLDDLGAAAQRVSASIMTEIASLDSKLHTVHETLDHAVKTTFNSLVDELDEHRAETTRLRQMLSAATAQHTQDNMASTNHLRNLLAADKTAREEESAQLMRRIQELMDFNTRQQNIRLEELSNVPAQLQTLQDSRDTAFAQFAQGSDSCMTESEKLGSRLASSRDALTGKLQQDSRAVQSSVNSLRSVTSSVHDETTRIIADQIHHVDDELKGLDRIVSEMQSQNNSHHAVHEASLQQLATTVQTSYTSIGGTFESSFARIKSLSGNIADATSSLHDIGVELDDDHLCRPLAELREQVESEQLQDDTVTGQTPARRTYPAPDIPQPQDREGLLAKFQRKSPSKPRSPTKQMVFADIADKPRLRELDRNASLEAAAPPQKRLRKSGFDGSLRMDRENVLTGRNLRSHARTGQ